WSTNTATCCAPDRTTTAYLGCGPDTGKPSTGRRSASGMTVPLRFATPVRVEGTPGTGVTDSTSKTSRTCLRSTANSSPPRVMRQIRCGVSPGCGSAAGLSCDGTVSASSILVNDAGHAGGRSIERPLHSRQQVLGFKRFHDVPIGALLLSPELIAFLPF